MALSSALCLGLAGREKRRPAPLTKLTKRISQRSIHGECTGRPDSFGDFGEKRDGHRGDTGLLDDALNQPDRLVAHGSNRRQKNRIHAIVAQPARDFRRAAGNQAPGAEIDPIMLKCRGAA